MVKLVETILKGVLGGVFTGFILGFYLTVLTRDYVIEPGHFQTEVLFEQGQVRFTQVVMLGCMGILALVGPFIVAAEFGPWLRHAVYGLVACLALVVGGALLGSRLMNEPLVYDSKMADRTCIDAARLYGIPTAFVLGPIVGMLIGGAREKWYRQEPGNIESSTRIMS